MMQGIANNHNREKIENINNSIMNLAEKLNFEDEEAKQVARKELADMIEERKRLFEEGNGVININGYETDMAELQDMAQRWSAKDIAKEFEISTTWVHILLKSTA